MRSVVSLVCVWAVLGAAGAHADERCLTVDEFNDWAATTGRPAVRGRLVFDFVAPSLVGRYRADAVVADMADRRTLTARGTACSGFQLKSWGDCRLPDDTVCSCSGMPCDGVLKLEGFDECGPSAGEAPFDPWHSQPVFTEDGRTCHLELFFDETAHGYDLTCTGLTIPPGRGENVFATQITFVSVLENVGGGNAFDGAVLSSTPMFCFDDGSLPGDAGVPGVDAGSGMLDGGNVDSGVDGMDSGSGVDGAASADAGRGAPPDVAGGCACRATSDATGSLAGALTIVAVLGGRKRRTPRG
jgi:MYXO-CTERM domain-containing protein